MGKKLSFTPLPQSFSVPNHVGAIGATILRTRPELIPDARQNAVLQTLIYHYDPISGLIGLFGRSGECASLPTEYLARHAGISERDVATAISGLITAELISEAPTQPRVFRIEERLMNTLGEWFTTSNNRYRGYAESSGKPLVVGKKLRIPRATQKASGAWAGTGNRCGHRPHHPQAFVPPENHRHRPGDAVWGLSIRMFDYYIDPEILPPLNNLTGSLKKNGEVRRQRSERREAIIRVLAVMLHYLDQATLLIGIPDEAGKIQPISQKFIAERADISIRQVQEACADLQNAGIIKTFRRAQRCKRKKRGYRGLPALRVVSPHIFKAFGLHKQLKKDRKRASEARKKQRQTRAEEARAQAEEQSRAKIQLAMDGAKHRYGASTSDDDERSPSAILERLMRRLGKAGNAPPAEK